MISMSCVSGINLQKKKARETYTKRAANAVVHFPLLPCSSRLEQHTACGQLCQNAAKAPHINLLVVGQAQDDLGSTVRAALHVQESASVVLQV